MNKVCALYHIVLNLSYLILKFVSKGVLCVEENVVIKLFFKPT